MVREALGLDVAGLVEVLLDEALTATERRDRLAGGGVEQLGDFLARAGDLEPTTATAERGQAVRIMTGAPIPAGADAVVVGTAITGVDLQVAAYRAALQG